MKNRAKLLPLVAICSLLLSGCAAVANSVEPIPASSTGTPADNSPAPGAGHMGHNANNPAPAPSSAAGPSDAALMVCGPEPLERLKSILHLANDPHTINSWANSTFTCTYHLDQGALTITVQEAPNPQAARTYFDANQALATAAKPIDGLANLGFPAYETPDGSAVFQKDNFILTVNATALPHTNGPDNITRNALAYQLATTILACWTEHH